MANCQSNTQNLHAICTTVCIYLPTINNNSWHTSPQSQNCHQLGICCASTLITKSLPNVVKSPTTTCFHRGNTPQYILRRCKSLNQKKKYLWTSNFLGAGDVEDAQHRINVSAKPLHHPLLTVAVSFALIPLM